MQLLLQSTDNCVMQVLFILEGTIPLSFVYIYYQKDWLQLTQVLRTMRLRITNRILLGHPLAQEMCCLNYNFEETIDSDIPVGYEVLVRIFSMHLISSNLSVQGINKLIGNQTININSSTELLLSSGPSPLKLIELRR